MHVFTAIFRHDETEEMQDLRFKCCEVLGIMVGLAHDCCLVCLCMHACMHVTSLDCREEMLDFMFCVPSGGGDDHGMLCQRPGTQGGFLQRCKTLAPLFSSHVMFERLSVCTCVPACLKMSACLKTLAGCLTVVLCLSYLCKPHRLGDHGTMTME